MFKIEIRNDCKVCGGDLPVRHRTYCSMECRLKVQYKRNYQRYGKAYQRNRIDKAHSKPSKDTIQCLICGRWYRQVGTHIAQRHKITARDYRKEYGFDVKRGQLPNDLRELKAKHVFKNGTVNNLKKGKKYRFVKGGENVGVYERSEQTIKRLKKQITKDIKHKPNQLKQKYDKTKKMHKMQSK